jgi:guanylate kinase
MIVHNEWLEYFNAPGVHRGHYYGTKKSDIDDVHRQGKIPIKEVQIDGLQQVIDNYADQYDIISLFLTISDEEIRKRIHARGSVTYEEMLEERILHTQRERDFAQKYCTYFIDSTPALDIVQTHIKDFMDKILK